MRPPRFQESSGIPGLAPTGTPARHYAGVRAKLDALGIRVHGRSSPCCRNARFLEKHGSPPVSGGRTLRLAAR